MTIGGLFLVRKKSMNSLAFNVNISQLLRGKYYFGLGVLPIGLMFASFLILWPFAFWLGGYLGIPEDAPVKDQPNGILWAVIFLSVMIALMIFGYLLGWLLNAIIARTILGWDAYKATRVFLYSEVPSEWMKDGANLGDNVVNIENEAWAITREKGKWNYILTKGVLGWGACMYLLMAILPVLRENAELSFIYFIWQAVVWSTAGALFGGTIWYFSETHYMKKINSNTSSK